MHLLFNTKMMWFGDSSIRILCRNSFSCTSSANMGANTLNMLNLDWAKTHPEYCDHKTWLSTECNLWCHTKAQKTWADLELGWITGPAKSLGHDSFTKPHIVISLLTYVNHLTWILVLMLLISCILTSVFFCQMWFKLCRLILLLSSWHTWPARSVWCFLFYNYYSSVVHHLNIWLFHCNLKSQ